MHPKHREGRDATRGTARGGYRAAFGDWPEAFGAGWGPGFGRGPRGRGRGGRGRARRGDVRAAILGLLTERPMHGYEIIQELAERTGGLWQPSAGSVYPTLQLLEEEGLVAGEDAEGKRRFTLTDAGREESQRRDGPPPWEQVTEGVDPNLLKLRDAVFQTMAAVKQVAMAGTADQKARAVDVLSDARRKLYAILSEDA